MVLIVLHRHNFKKNNCFVAIKTIAREAGLCVRTLQPILKGLETKRFIKKHNRPGFTTIYETLSFGF